MAAETGEGVDMDISDPTHRMNLGMVSGSVTVLLPAPWAMVVFSFFFFGGICPT